MIKVGVVFGGESVEHEVSIISAVQAMKHFNGEKYEVVPIYITKNKEMYTGAFLNDIETYKDYDILKRYAKNIVMYVRDNKIVLQNKKGLFKSIVNEIDIVFPIVHGTNVEDGTLQGYLDTLGIPYVGSKVCTCAIGQDKVFQKQVFQSSGISICDYDWFFDEEYLTNQEKIIERIEKIKYPLIIKPANLGSSVGISKANNREELIKGIDEAIKYDTKIVVEKVVENLKEVNASVLGDYTHYEISELESVSGSDEFLSYADKYIGDSKGKVKPSSSTKGMVNTKRVIPANIDKKLYNEIIEISETAAKVLNLSGVARIDYLIDSKAKKVYINEVNTIPGSLSFYLWEPKGKSYDELLDEMVTTAVKFYKRRSKLTYSFESNILSNFNGSKGKLKG